MRGYFDDLKIDIVLHHWADKWHGRESIAENNSLVFIPAGELLLQRQGRKITLEGPVCFWFFKGDRILFSLQKNAKIEHYEVHFSGPRSERMLTMLDEKFPQGCFHPVEGSLMTESFHQLMRLYRSAPATNHPDMVALLETILATSLHTLQKNGGQDADPYDLETLASQFRSEPFLDYDFHAIAQTLSITITHLRRIFRRKFGCTAREYLMRQRMIRVAEMLSNSEMQIKKIQYTSLFSSAIDFCRSFKNYYGVSPSAYRRNHRKHDGK